MTHPVPARSLVSPNGFTSRTNVAWRFYVCPDGAWRWQQLAVDQTVLCESSSASATYDDCLRDAEAQGYRHAASQEKVAAPRTYPKEWR